jgi:2,3-bisphosphoglycerate-independent phosphoglycerate mutase
MIRPIVLLILDGWGIRAQRNGNAILQAKKPFYESLLSSMPYTFLDASGEAVGLPRDEVGNTETGHLNIGAGRIVYQDLPRINMAIADGSFYTNPEFLKAIEHTKKFRSTMHILGLIGAGGVHANNEHLLALLFLMRDQGVKNVLLHLFTDGRDSPPNSGLSYVKQIESELKRIGIGRIGTLMGRYYAMDRDLRWDRTGLAYEAMTQAKGLSYITAEEAIAKSYNQGITDEFIKPSIILTPGTPPPIVQENDALIFYNFRIDRPRQLTKAFVVEDLSYELSTRPSAGFTLGSLFNKKSDIPWRVKKLSNIFFVTMTEYVKSLPVSIAFPPQQVRNPFGQVVSEHALRQLRLTESEKERFVTFYFNGQREMPFIGEDRIIIPSLKVATYDKTPQMQAMKIADSLILKLKENVYDVYIVNFANADMVGHTGNLAAATKACETIDACLSRVVPLVMDIGGICAITADHGNAEDMLDEHNNPTTEHSANKVPFILCGKDFANKKTELHEGSLADIAPTLLQLMQVQVPIEMTGKDLLSTVDQSGK